VALDSPWSGEAPEVKAVVYRDGLVFAEGCGAHTVTEPGVYRVRVDIVPHHLLGFLGTASSLVHSYPWLYSQAFRVGL
jgi:hypothetical protein